MEEIRKINKVLVVIPARLIAKRLPRKLLINLLEKPLIQWVYEGCLQSKLTDKIIIATDSEEILNCARNFGAEVMMTNPEHKTGSDRVAEVAEKMPEYDIVINVQGDNPFVTGELVDSLIKPLIEKDIYMAALKSRIKSRTELENPSIVKVMTDKNNFAITYSRAVIPHYYNFDNLNVNYYRNKGLYGFKRDFLLKYVGLSRSPLEQAESLEQMRAIEHGYKIYVVETDIETFEINVPEDVKVVEEKLRERENEE